MKAYILAFFLSIILLSSCRKKNSWPTPDMSRLQGTWNWVESDGGLFFTVLTPVSTGTTMELEFTERQIFRKTENGKKTETYLFDVVQYENTSADSEYKLHLRKRVSHTEPISSYQLSGISFRSNDTLILKDGGSDGFAHLFIRK